MDREIKFRGWHKGQKRMFQICTINSCFVTEEKSDVTYSYINNSLKNIQIMQFTGMNDKNGVDIYEGDILEFWGSKRYTQQSHLDVKPEIDENYLFKYNAEVRFHNGMFTIETEFSKEHYYYSPLTELGFRNIQEIREHIFENIQNFDEEDMQTDINGNEINEEKIGIKVIGNIYENPKLIK